MFWKKEVNPIEKLIIKWYNEINTYLSEDVETYRFIDAIIDIAEETRDSAMMVRPRETKLVIKNYKEEMNILIKGSFSVGLELGNLLSSTVGALLKANELLKFCIFPITDTAMKLIELSHCEGRIIVLPENKEEVKSSTAQGIKTASEKIFQAGCKFSNLLEVRNKNIEKRIDGINKPTLFCSNSSIQK
jgi:hypothetical protein